MRFMLASVVSIICVVLVVIGFDLSQTEAFFIGLLGGTVGGLIGAEWEEMK